MATSEVSDENLALWARDGQRDAFDRLVVRHKASLYRFIRHYVGDADDAYDILQETFISIWLSLSRFDPGRNFSAWMRTIALNKCRDFGRRQSVRQKFLRAATLFQSWENDVVYREQIKKEDATEERLLRLDAAIVALPSFYKEPLLLTMVLGLSHKEAAEQLGTTTKAVEMRVRRARLMLRKAVGDSNAEPSNQLRDQSSKEATVQIKRPIEE